MKKIKEIHLLDSDPRIPLRTDRRTDKQGASINHPRGNKLLGIEYIASHNGN